MRASLHLVLALSVTFLAVSAFAQSQSQPLGDVARQQQLQKQQAPAQKVITNEDIPSANAPEPQAANGDKSAEGDSKHPAKTKELPNADAMRSKISAQKQKVKELETKIAADKKQLGKHDRTEEIEHGTGMGTTIARDVPDYCDMPTYMQEQRGYKEWCDEPAKLKAEIEDFQKQLDTERATLDGMQEEARRQGFGNSVYDPD